MPEFGFETRIVQQDHLREGGTDADGHGAVIPPLHLSTTFENSSPGVSKGKHIYTRSSNPNRASWEAAAAEMEGGEHGFAFSSGMAATNALLWLLRPGDHVVASKGGYGGTHRLMSKVAGAYGIACDFVDTGDVEQVDGAMTDATRMLLLETPTNPHLRLTDLAALAELGRRRKAVTVADNTFMSPYYQRPLEHGIDVVYHSSTKYLGGHSDVLGGVVITSDADLAERIGYIQNAAGTVPSPFDCWMLSRSSKTLAVRMRQHSANAMAVARFLGSHKGVKRVLYPGLESHPQHELAKRQQRDPRGEPGFGGMVSFELADPSLVDGAAGRLRVFKLAESLGGVESLFNHPFTMTHSSLEPAVRADMNITPGLVRLSVGIETAEDLVADLRGVLEGR